jgi:hypothetical protein
MDFVTASFEVGSGGGEFIGVPAIENDFSARFGEALGEAQADAPT